MTTSLPHTHVRLRDLSELVAGIPYVLGFPPTDSLVLFTFRRCPILTLSTTIRVDLPKQEHVVPVASELSAAAARNEAVAAIAVVVGEDAPERRELVQSLRKTLADNDILLTHASWVRKVVHGEQWQCYDDPLCTGSVPDPQTSALAAAIAVAGDTTYPDREAVAAHLAPDPAEALARRKKLLDAYRTGHLQPYGEQELEADLRTLGHALDMALSSYDPPSLNDHQLVRLAMAMSQAPIRDECLAIALTDEPEPTERLWTVLVRSLPIPERAEPAVLLAVSAYLRGAGVLAALALKIALDSNPQHRTALLLDYALQMGMPPTRLKSMLKTCATNNEEEQNTPLPTEDDPPWDTTPEPPNPTTTPAPQTPENPQAPENPQNLESPLAPEGPRTLENSQAFENPRVSENLQAFGSPQAVENLQVLGSRQAFASPPVSENLQAFESPQVLGSRQAFASPRVPENLQAFESPQALENLQAFASSQVPENLQVLRSPQVPENQQAPANQQTPGSQQGPESPQALENQPLGSPQGPDNLRAPENSQAPGNLTAHPPRNPPHIPTASQETTTPRTTNAAPRNDSNPTAPQPSPSTPKEPTTPTPSHTPEHRIKNTAPNPPTTEEKDQPTATTTEAGPTPDQTPVSRPPAKPAPDTPSRPQMPGVSQPPSATSSATEASTRFTTVGGSAPPSRPAVPPHDDDPLDGLDGFPTPARTPTTDVLTAEPRIAPGALSQRTATTLSIPVGQTSVLNALTAFLPPPSTEPLLSEQPLTDLSEPA